MSGAPEWIELIPPGPEIQGRDGRCWLNDNPAGIVALFRKDAVPLPLDYEHATETIAPTAPQGGAAPAAGWIEALDLRGDSSIWGRVAWTDKARAMVDAREYRFISPAFLFDRVTRAIRKLTSAALTHHPNFLMTALSRDGSFPAGSMVLALNRAGAPTAILSESEREICGRMGIDPTAFARAKGEG